MTDQLRAAAQAVVDVTDQEGYCGPETIGYAIEALRAALAEPQGAPVAWRYPIDDGYNEGLEYIYNVSGDGEPLYTHPAPLRELSDEEILAAAKEACVDDVDWWQEEILEFARAIIAAAKEKA